MTSEIFQSTSHFLVSEVKFELLYLISYSHSLSFFINLVVVFVLKNGLLIENESLPIGENKLYQ